MSLGLSGYVRALASCQCSDDGVLSFPAFFPKESHQPSLEPTDALSGILGIRQNRTGGARQNLQGFGKYDGLLVALISSTCQSSARTVTFCGQSPMGDRPHILPRTWHGHGGMLSADRGVGDSSPHLQSGAGVNEQLDGELVSGAAS